METNDQPRAAAENYIRDAINILHVVHSNRLDHSDKTTVKAAVEGLRIVLRSTFGLSVADDARIAERLRQVAGDMKSCLAQGVSIACAEVKAAARIFQAMADGM